MKLLIRLGLFLIIIQLTSCNESGQKTIFSHGINPEKSMPWTHDRFDNANDKFTFAIISDLYGGERPGIFEVAIDQINLLRPEFILTVGDLIDGGTEDRDQLIKEWEHFDQRASKAVAPVFHAGGNHDLTNITMREVWEERYGQRYYHFLYNEVLFLVLDSEDFSEKRIQEIYHARATALQVLETEPEKYPESEYYSMPERRTGEIGEEQSSYFENVIQEHPDVRWTILLMHKPVWMREDNHGLQRIESVLSDRDYTVINGHFHAYSHTVKNDMDYIMLGTTGGSQNPQNESAFDHISLVTMTDEGPSIANLRLEGILDKRGLIPADGQDLCYQASRCIDETN
jgi:hypothetical protein